MAKSKDNKNKYKIAGDRWLTEENVNALIENYLGEHDGINLLDSTNLSTIGRNVEDGTDIGFGGGVAIAQTGDVFNELFTQYHLVAAQQERDAPSKYIVPVNVNAGGGAKTFSGNHWALAVIEKQNDINTGDGNARPSISVQYIDPLKTAGERDGNADIVHEQLANTFNVTDFRNISCGQQSDGWSCGYITVENAVNLAAENAPKAAYSNRETENLYRKANGAFRELTDGKEKAADDVPEKAKAGDSKPQQTTESNPEGRNVSFDPNVKVYEYEPVSNDNLTAEELGNSFLPAVNRSDNSRIDKSKWLSNFGIDKANRSALRNAGEVNLFDSDYEPVGAVSDLRPSVSVVEATDIKNFGDRLKEILDSKPDALREQNLASGVAPDRLLIPLNVNFEGDISKKGDHWILAEVSERSGETDGKQNIAVRYLDPAYKNGKSPNLQHTQKQLEKHFNIEGGQIEDLSNAQQPIGNEWGCGYIVCDAIEKLAKDPDDESVQQRYSHKQMDQLHDKIAGGVAKEDSRVDRSLEERMKSLNGTLKSYRSLMDDPLQSADIAKTMLGFIYDPANEKKPAGKKTGLIGRIENIFEDFNADKSSDIVYSAYSVIANAIGLLKDIFVGTAVAVLDNVDTREKIQQDIKKFEAQKDALLQKQIARLDKGISGKNAGGSGEVEANFRDVEIDTGMPSIEKTPASTEKERPKTPYDGMLDDNMKRAFSQIENVGSDDIGKVSPPKTPVVESEKNKAKGAYDDMSENKENIHNHGSQIKNQRNGNPLQSR